MKDAEKAALARAWLRQRKSLEGVETADVCWRYHLPHRAAETVLNREKLRRGIITFADLNPVQRRALVNPKKLDLHAIAAGPIMDSNQIYLPAGKISLAEAKAREAQQVFVEAAA